MPESELHNIMEPYVADWKKVMQADLMNQTEDAKDKNRLSAGMIEVWETACRHRGKLLIISRNFIYPAEHDSKKNNLRKYDESSKKAFYIKDAVDDVIEKVLANGGDVEFVDEHLLDEYGHIVLIDFYSH